MSVGLSPAPSRRGVLYSGIVWIVAGTALAVYSSLGFFGVDIPGVEELLEFLLSLEHQYLYIAAALSIFIEGIYFVGSFFPGSTLVLILAIISQLENGAVFLITIVSIFVAWCLAGAINVYGAYMYRARIAKLAPLLEYDVKDRYLTTWFPAFRANYEVAQIAEGGDPWKVFFSSLRVKFWASVAAMIATLIIPLFIDVNQLSNEDGFVSVAIVAGISVVVGVVKVRRYVKMDSMQ